MSVHKNCIVLDNAEVQYNTEATTPALNRRDTQIPLFTNGEAVRTVSIPTSATTLRAAAVATASYIGSTAIDLAGVNSVVIRALVGTTNAETFSMKPQWSLDNTNWTDEVELSGSTSGTERLLTPLSRVIQISGASASFPYIERYNRLARYFRVAVKSDGTTATLSVVASRLSN